MRKNLIAAAFFAALLFVITPLFAKGKTDEAERKSVNREYVLCVTAFNVSTLPAGLQVLGPILQRDIARDLERIHHRVRTGGELTRYEELAWMEAVHATANEIAKKREERDNLLFKGYPNWKYKKELKKIDKDIAALEEKYATAREVKPIIEEQPLFKLLAGNTSAPGTFPVPPEKGREEAFLRNNKADAFLEGKFRIYYGRLYVEFRIFTRGASFIYNDSFIFSSENINIAADQIKNRFLGTMINSELVRLVLNADPEDSKIEVNGVIVKKGQVVELPPGPVVISVSAEDHFSIKEDLLMEGGEQELSYELTPIEKETLRIKLPGPNSLVYSGAMYRGGNPVPKQEEIIEEEVNDDTEEAEIETGETTITENDKDDDDETAVVTEQSEKENESIAEQSEEEDTDLVAEQSEEETEEEDPQVVEARAGFFSVYVPMGQFQYIRVETEDGLTGEAIVKGNPDSKEVRIIELKPRKLPGRDDNPVEKSRKKFYGAYGRFWITLPLAFIINGVAQGYFNSYASTRNPEMYNNYEVANYISIGAWSVTGIFLAETLVRMFVYVHTGTKEAIPYIE
jgi:hypothetical protein